MQMKTNKIKFTRNKTTKKIRKKKKQCERERETLIHTQQYRLGQYKLESDN